MKFEFFTELWQAGCSAVGGWCLSFMNVDINKDASNILQAERKTIKRRKGTSGRQKKNKLAEAPALYIPHMQYMSIIYVDNINDK